MGRFKPEYGQPYHFATHYGSVETVGWCDDTADNLRYDTGNCFRTKQEAFDKIVRDRAIASGRAVVVDVPDGWEVQEIIHYPEESGPRPAVTVCFKRTPPPPKEIVVKVYDVEVHGDPIHGRLYVYVGKGLYIYPNEAEGL